MIAAAPLLAVSTARFLTVVVAALVVVGIVLVVTGIRLLRSTRTDHASLGPLEVMSDRRWRRRAPEHRADDLDRARPEGAEPLSQTAAGGAQSADPEPASDDVAEESEEPVEEEEVESVESEEAAAAVEAATDEPATEAAAEVVEEIDESVDSEAAEEESETAEPDEPEPAIEQAEDDLVEPEPEETEETEANVEREPDSDVPEEVVPPDLPVAAVDEDAPQVEDPDAPDPAR